MIPRNQARKEPSPRYSNSRMSFQAVKKLELDDVIRVLRWDAERLESREREEGPVTSVDLSPGIVVLLLGEVDEFFGS